MAVTLRHATADDARAIAEVHVAAWCWAYRGQLPDELLDRLSVDDREAFWAAWFLAPEDRGAVIVACDEDRVIGFANVGPSRDDDAPDQTGEVRAIYVQQEAQGTGVGARLMDEAERLLRASGFERATLWVLATNDLGRRFYERNGWTWDGTTSDHQFDGANRPIIRYARDLD
jgi:GNAT superfamily N-acetyltransferase